MLEPRDNQPAILVTEGSLRKWYELYEIVTPEEPYDKNFAEFKKMALCYIDENKQLSRFEELMRNASLATIGKDESHVKYYRNKEESYHIIFESYLDEIKKGMPAGISFEDNINLQCSKIMGSIEILIKPPYSSQVLHPGVSLVYQMDEHRDTIKFIPDNMVQLGNEIQLLELAKSDTVFEEVEDRCITLLQNLTDDKQDAMLLLRSWITALINVNHRVSELYEPQYQLGEVNADVAKIVQTSDQGYPVEPIHLSGLKKPSSMLFHPDASDLLEINSCETTDFMLCNLYNDMVLLKYGLRGSTGTRRNDISHVFGELKNARMILPTQLPAYYREKPISIFETIPVFLKDQQPPETFIHSEVFNKLLRPLRERYVFTNNKVGIIKVEDEKPSILENTSTSIGSCNNSEDMTIDLRPEKLFDALLKVGLEHSVTSTISRRRVYPDMTISVKIKSGSANLNNRSGPGGDTFEFDADNSRSAKICTIEVKSVSRLVTIIKLTVLYLEHLRAKEVPMGKEAMASFFETLGVHLSNAEKTTFQQALNYGRLIMDQLFKQLLVSKVKVGLLVNLSDIIVFELPPNIMELHMMSKQYQDRLMSDTFFPYVTCLSKHVNIKFNTVFGRHNNTAMMSGFIIQRVQDLLNMSEEPPSDDSFTKIQNMIESFDPVLRCRRIVQQLVLLRYLDESDADMVRKCGCLLLGEEEKGTLEQLEWDLNEQVKTFYDGEILKKLGGVITLASEFSEKIEVVGIIKGEIAYSDDSFSTVVHVKEFENVSGGTVRATDVVLKILDSSRFRLDLNSSFFVSNVELAKLDGVKVPLENDYIVQMNTINNIKLAIHNYFTELEAYLLIRESCPETWRFFLPNLIEFGVYLNNIAEIHESKTIFAEGLFFKFSYIEEVDAHGLDTQSKAIIVAEAFSHLQLIHTSGVSHRDLSASNLLVNKRDDGNFGIVFIDFGSSIQIKTHLRGLSLTKRINDFNDLSIGRSLNNFSDVLLEKFPHIAASLRDDFAQDYLALRAALIKKGLDVDIMEMNPDNIPMFAERDLSVLKRNG